jgi:hypothetical protein
MTVQVTEMVDNRPVEVVFRFDVPLEDPTLRWFAWENGAVVPFTPPAVGAHLIVRPCDGSPLMTVFPIRLAQTEPAVSSDQPVAASPP